jgi:hypothetical protein
MHHEKLDIAVWKSVFPLPDLQKQAKSKNLGGGVISGPCDIAILEQLRDLSYAEKIENEKVPTDIFIWSLGEPVQRSVTKIA